MDVALVAAEELVEALAEVLDALLDVLWDGMSALGHQLHSDHISNSGDNLLFGMGKLLGVLLCNFLGSLSDLGLAGIIKR